MAMPAASALISERQGVETSVAPPADELLPLSQAAARGDADAAERLVTVVGGAMLRAVRKVLGGVHPEVEDVTQDAVIAFVTALPGFRGDCTVIHFASRIAVLTAMSARRRLSTRARFTEAESDLPNAAAGCDGLEDRHASSPLESALAARRREIVRNLLDELSEPVAEALALHFMLGYTVEEIAAACSVPHNTVWSRLRLGKQGLRRRLAKTENAEAWAGASDE
jgi:RNA polymerase sigma factor (sigma-70 family)